MEKMEIYKYNELLFTKDALMRILRQDNVLIVIGDSEGTEDEYDIDFECCLRKSSDMADEKVLEYAALYGFVIRADDSVFAQLGIIKDTLCRVKRMCVNT